MEKAIYETKPYAFMILGAAALMAHTPYPKITHLSALLLLACSSAIIYWRITRRAQLARVKR